MQPSDSTFLLAFQWFLCEPSADPYLAAMVEVPIVSSHHVVFSSPEKVLLISSLLCFVLSLLATTFALGGLPSVNERLQSTAPDEKGIYDMSVYWHFRVYQIVFAEHLFFVLGVILFSGFLGLSIASR